jgi:hypothetical protein
MCLFAPVACPVPRQSSRAVLLISPEQRHAAVLNSSGEVMSKLDWVEVMVVVALLLLLVYCVARAVERGLTLYLARKESLRLFGRLAEALYFKQARDALISILERAPASPLADVLRSRIVAGSLSRFPDSASARELANYLVMIDARRKLWELPLAAAVSVVIAWLFFFATIDNALSDTGRPLDIQQPFEVFAVGVLSAMVAFCAHKCLMSSSDDLCLTVDTLSLVLLERLSSEHTLAHNSLADFKRARPRRSVHLPRARFEESHLTLLHLLD